MNSIFNLDTTTNELDFKKLTILFQQNNLPAPNKELVSYLQEYYNNKTLTLENITTKDTTTPYNDSVVTNFINSRYSENELLNKTQLINDIKNIDNTLSDQDISDFIEKIYNGETSKDIKIFSDYIINLFEQ